MSVVLPWIELLESTILQTHLAGIGGCEGTAHVPQLTSKRGPFYIAFTGRSWAARMLEL